jgi:hypothetical protein
MIALAANRTSQAACLETSDVLGDVAERLRLTFAGG